MRARLITDTFTKEPKPYFCCIIKILFRYILIRVKP